MLESMNEKTKQRKRKKKHTATWLECKYYSSSLLIWHISIPNISLVEKLKLFPTIGEPKTFVVIDGIFCICEVFDSRGLFTGEV